MIRPPCILRAQPRESANNCKILRSLRMILPLARWDIHVNIDRLPEAQTQSHGPNFLLPIIKHSLFLQFCQLNPPRLAAPSVGPLGLLRSRLFAAEKAAYHYP